MIVGGRALRCGWVLGVGLGGGRCAAGGVVGWVLAPGLAGSGGLCALAPPAPRLLGSVRSGGASAFGRVGPAGSVGWLFGPVVGGVRCRHEGCHVTSQM